MADLQEYNDIGVDPFDSPIPGESLTADPSVQRPWERPPEFTDVNDAIQDLFLRITNEDNYEDIMDQIREGTPLDEMTQMFLFTGYTRGKWNVDLMLLLAEPTLYLLIALAEHNQIFDYTVYEGEQDDLTEEEKIQMLDNDIQKMRSSKKRTVRLPAKEVLPTSLLNKIEEVPVASDMEGEE